MTLGKPLQAEGSRPAHRAATARDIPALAALGRESFIAKFGHLYRSEDLQAFIGSTFSESAVAAELADPGTLYRVAAAPDESLAAYCKIALSSSFGSYARGRHPMELKQLYTHPAATGKGIGAVLMDWAMTEFHRRGADEVHLSVWSGNEGAQRFYARYGFTKLADIDFWVGAHRDDEFLFARMI